MVTVIADAVPCSPAMKSPAAMNTGESRVETESPLTDIAGITWLAAAAELPLGTTLRVIVAGLDVVFAITIDAIFTFVEAGTV